MSLQRHIRKKGPLIPESQHVQIVAAIPKKKVFFISFLNILVALWPFLEPRKKLILVKAIHN